MAEPTSRAASISLSTRAGEREGSYYLDRDHKVISLSRDPVARAHELSFSEVRLARWLHRHLNMAGALEFVATYGAARILDRIYDGVVEEVAVSYQSTLYHRPTVRRINPELHSPGGFLRWVLEGGA